MIHLTVIITHNRPRRLRLAVESARQQPGSLVVIYNQNENLESMKMIESIQSLGIACHEFPNKKKDYRHRNSFESALRNYGAGLLGSKWLSFLDDDDIFTMGRVKKMLSVARGSKIFYGHMVQDKWVKKKSKRIIQGIASQASRSQIINFIGIGTPAVMMKRSVWEDMKWPEDCKASEDKIYFRRLAKKGYKFKYIPIPVALLNFYRGNCIKCNHAITKKVPSGLIELRGKLY